MTTVTAVEVAKLYRRSTLTPTLRSTFPRGLHQRHNRCNQDHHSHIMFRVSHSRFHRRIIPTRTRRRPLRVHHHPIIARCRSSIRRYHPVMTRKLTRTCRPITEPLEDRLMRGIPTIVGTLHKVVNTRFRTESHRVLTPVRVPTHKGYPPALRSHNIHTNWDQHHPSRSRTTQAEPSKPLRYPAGVFTTHHTKRLVAQSNNPQLKNPTWTILASKIANSSRACSRSRLHRLLR